MLKVDGLTANMLVAIALAIAAPFYIFFGWLSDRIGRKTILMAGLALAAISYFPAFHLLTEAANPALARAQSSAPVVGRRRPDRVLVPIRSDRPQHRSTNGRATSPSPF